MPKRGITISLSPALAAAATLQGLKAQNKVICTFITARINPCPFAPGPRPTGRLSIAACLCYALGKMDEKNKLYFGDNLKILRDYVVDASVDLIYLDPPFNSSAAHPSADGQWGLESEAVYRGIIENGPRKLGDLKRECHPSTPFRLKVC